MKWTGSLRAAMAGVVFVVLAGCSTTPPVPAGSLVLGDRVGVLVQSSDHPAHSHLGIMVFGNFAKTYPYQWHVGPKVFDALDKTIRARGLATVDLAKENVRLDEATGLVQIQDKKWVVTPGKEAAFHHLRDDLKLKAVVVLRPARVMAMSQCTQFGCTEFYIDGPGVFSRAFGTNLSAVAGFRWSVVNLDDVVDLALAPPLKGELSKPTASMDRTDNADDVAGWGPQEWSQVEDTIAVFTSDVMDQALHQLKKGQ